MKKLFLVTALVFGMAAASQAATTITESNLPPVSILNPLDFLRVNLKSTTGASRSMTASNFATWLGTNGIASTNYAQSLTNLLRMVRSTDPAFPFTQAKTASNQLINVCGLGDSLADFLFSRKFYFYFADYYGRGGASGNGGSTLWNPYGTGGAVATNNYNKWFGQFWHMPSNSIVTFTNNAYGYTTGNVVAVKYFATNGAGSLQLQTNNGANGWVNWGASINANNGGTGAGVTVRLTNAGSVALPLMPRLVSGSTGMVELLGAAVYDYSRPGAVYNLMGPGGARLTDFLQVPDAIKGPILRTENPELVFWKWTDIADSAATFRANIIALNTFEDTYLTNSDFLTIGCHPLEVTDDQSIVQNYIQFTNAIMRGQSYFDLYSSFGSFARGLAAGHLALSDVHCTTLGDVYSSDCLAGWMQLWNRHTRTAINGPATPLWTGGNYTAAGDLDLSGNIRIHPTPGQNFGISSGTLDFVDGSLFTNLLVYLKPTAGGNRSLTIRDQAGGYDILEIRAFAGIASLLPADASSGVNSRIGGSAVGEAWRSLFVTNITVYASPLNKGVLQSDANGAGTWALPYCLQEVRTLSNALQTVTMTVPLAFDDTTFTVAEGTNVLLVTITPQRSDTSIIVEAHLNFGGSALMKVGAGIFRDAAAAAAGVGAATLGGSTYVGQIHLYSKFPSTATSATTFAVKIGSDTGTVYMQGYGGTAARLFGGTQESWVVAREVNQ